MQHIYLCVYVCTCAHIKKIWAHKHIKKGWIHSNMFFAAYGAEKSIELQMTIFCSSISFVMETNTTEVCTLFNLIWPMKIYIPPFILFWIVLLWKMSRAHVIQRENNQFSFPIGLGIWVSKLKREISSAEQYFVQRFFGDLNHLKWFQQSVEV